MKLLTKEIINRFAKVGSQSESKDPIIIAKFFDPTGAGTWFAAYLTIQHLRGAAPFCTLLEGCEVVTTSEYNEL